MVTAIPLVFARRLEDRDPDRLIATGVFLIVCGICSQYANDLHKPLFSRPRPRYLATLDDPATEFRAWWQLAPYTDGPSDAVGSCPSNHMMLATLMLNLPIIVSAVNHRSEAPDRASIVIACAYVVVMAYNRIQMGGHFLSDVCLGVLLTTCLLRLFFSAFLGPYVTDGESRVSE